jgi:hypothetical protein
VILGCWPWLPIVGTVARRERDSPGTTLFPLHEVIASGMR